MEDAVYVLPVAPAVDVPLDVPDLVTQLGFGARPLNFVDELDVKMFAWLHLAEDDVPNVDIRRRLLDRVLRSFLRCYS
jgi:hypothetical protein